MNRSAPPPGPTDTGLARSFSAVVLLLVGIAFFTGPGVAPRSQLAASIVALSIAFVLVNPRLGSLRWPDLFAPMAFPALYVGFSFIAPAWAHQIHGTHFAVEAGGVPQSPNTVGLMCASALAFAAGCCMIRGRPWVLPEIRLHPPQSVVGFRLCGITAQVIMFYQAATENLALRGVNQLTSGHSVLDVAAPALAVVYIAGVGIGSIRAGRSRPFEVVDGILIVGLVIAPSLQGDRNVADSVVLAVGVVLAIAGRLSLLKVGAGVGVLLAISILVLAYRSNASGETVKSSKVDTILGDLAPAEFSTGAVAVAVPLRADYLHGSTVTASAVRLLPSPVFPLFGLSSAADSGSTASFAFRNLIGYKNPNNGLGFSIPAEGYLNFGFAGMLGACFLYGAAFSYSWRRLRARSSMVALASYVILVATLPICMRSDALGLGKGVLYPIALVGFIDWWSRDGRSGDQGGLPVTRTEFVPSQEANWRASA